MKKRLNYILVAVATIILSIWLINKLTTTDELRILETENFKIHYQQVSKLKMKSLLKKLEETREGIITNLGINEHPQTYIYVHPSTNEFVEHVGFEAIGAIKGVDTLHLLNLKFPMNLFYSFNETAVHEFVHNVTLNAIIKNALNTGKISSVNEFDNVYGEGEKRFDQIYPRWLWESLAVFEAGQFNFFTFNLSLKDGFPTLKALNSQNNNQIYHVGYSLIDYIISKWGRQKLIDLVLNDGDIEKILGISVITFETEWEKFVEDEYMLIL